jgi:hypothetical protein
MSNAHPTQHAILLILLQPYKLDVHICQPRHSAKATIRNLSSASSKFLLLGRRGWNSCSLPTFCTYWPTNPSFDPKWILLRRLFFINEDRTKYVSLGFYPARDYLPLVEFGVIRRGGGPKTLILKDKQVDAMAEGLSMLRDAMCSAETSVGGRGCASGAFRLDVTRIRRTARLYVDCQYIPITLKDRLSLAHV